MAWTWYDNFTTDNFTLGTARYTLLSGVENTDFNVLTLGGGSFLFAGLGSGDNAGFVSWQDRTAPVPLQSNVFFSGFTSHGGDTINTTMTLSLQDAAQANGISVAFNDSFTDLGGPESGFLVRTASILVQDSGAPGHTISQSYPVSGHLSGGYNPQVYYFAFDGANLQVFVNTAPNGGDPGQTATPYQSVIIPLDPALIAALNTRTLYPGFAVTQPVSSASFQMAGWGYNNFTKIESTGWSYASNSVPAMLIPLDPITVTPNHTPYLNPAPVTITSAGGMLGVTSVTVSDGIDGPTTPSFVIVDDMTLTVTIPAATAPTTGTITLDGAYSSSQSASFSWDFIPATFTRWTYGPIAANITDIDPYLFEPAGGETVQLTGNHFTGVTDVSIGGHSVAFTFNSDSSITTVAPAGTAMTTGNVIITTAAGTNFPDASNEVRWVGLISSWVDDFTTDHFTLGDHIYTLFEGTEGSSFTVAPDLLRVTHATNIAWADQRTGVDLPFVTTITLEAVPASVAFGFADGDLDTVSCLATLEGGTLSIKTIDPIDGLQTLGSVSYSQPTSVKLRMIVNTSTITVYDGSSADPGTVLTSAATPAHLLSALATYVVTPVVIGTGP